MLARTCVKRTILLWLFLSCTALGIRSAQASDLANGLVGYWPFNETSGGIAHDASGYGDNGTLINYPGGQGNWTTGITGGALQFGGPGTGQYVSVSNVPQPATSMTLTAWVWADSTPPWATIAANWSNPGPFSYSIFGSTPALSLYVADNGSHPGEFNIYYGGSSSYLTLNEWHFVAFVADSLTDYVTLWEDGEIVGMFQYPGQFIAAPPQQLNIGDDPSDGPGQGFWDGKIDDLAMWTRALSSQDLATIYNAGLAGQPLLTLIPEPSVVAIFSGAIPILLWFGFCGDRQKRWNRHKCGE